MTMNTLEHIVAKACDAAAGGINSQSKGEALMSALVLDRPDWLRDMDYTIPQALERIGPEWAALIPAAAKAVEAANYAIAQAERTARADAFLAGDGGPDDVIDLSATLLTTGEAPGYRDAFLLLDVEQVGTGSTRRVRLRIRPEDGEPIVEHLREVHQRAWRRGEPLDVKPGEKRPNWIAGAA